MISRFLIDAIVEVQSAHPIASETSGENGDKNCRLLLIQTGRQTSKSGWVNLGARDGLGRLTGGVLPGNKKRIVSQRFWHRRDFRLFLVWVLRAINQAAGHSFFDDAPDVKKTEKPNVCFHEDKTTVL